MSSPHSCHEKPHSSSAFGRKGEKEIPTGTLPDSFSRDSEAREVRLAPRIRTAATVLMSLLISGACLRSLCRPAVLPSSNHSIWLTDKGETRSNGSHEFRRTVIVVSIDGLRYFELFGRNHLRS